jgi:hypothetical protein
MNQEEKIRIEEHRDTLELSKLYIPLSSVFDKSSTECRARTIIEAIIY